MIINVTQADIDAGLPLQCYLCPLALAITRVLGKAAAVTSSKAYLNITGGESIKCSLPEEAIEFRTRFDCGRPVQPFSFKLEVK